jgi:lipoprotein-anchoring transpeptidase ErfK/SrfK
MIARYRSRILKVLPVAVFLAGAALTSELAAERSGEAQTARIEVDLSDRQLSLIVGDEVVATYPVAVGKADHETPTGDFSIRRIIWNPSWTPPDADWASDKKPTPPGDPDNPMGRVKIFFSEPDYYIHGTEAEESLGTAASHGCLRMSTDQVIELARAVMEYGGETRPASWFQRILNRFRDTEEVRLTHPMPMTVRR